MLNSLKIVNSKSVAQEKEKQICKLGPQNREAGTFLYDVKKIILHSA